MHAVHQGLVAVLHAAWKPGSHGGGVKRWNCRFVLALLLFVCGGRCLAASFNCSGQISAIERTICSNKELSSLDERMAQAFSVVREKFGSDALRDQREWLSQRDLCKSDVACLKRSYIFQIELLSMTNYAPRPKRGLGLKDLPPPTISDQAPTTIDVILQKCFADPACQRYSKALIPRFSKSTLIPESAVSEQLEVCAKGLSDSAICWGFRATFLENELADHLKAALHGADEACERRMERRQFAWERTVNTSCEERTNEFGSYEHARVYSSCRGDELQKKISVLKSVGSCQPCSQCLLAW